MLGERLRELRLEKGYTLVHVGDKIGVSDATLSNYEKGTRKPDWETIVRLADFYNVSTDYILGRTNIKRFKDLEDLDLESMQVRTIARGASELNREEREAIIHVMETFIKQEHNKRNNNS